MDNTVISMCSVLLCFCPIIIISLLLLMITHESEGDMIARSVDCLDTDNCRQIWIESLGGWINGGVEVVWEGNEEIGELCPLGLLPQLALLSTIHWIQVQFQGIMLINQGIVRSSTCRYNLLVMVHWLLTWRDCRLEFVGMRFWAILSLRL